MRIYSEISLESFGAWSGAVNTLDRIRNAGKCDVLESVLEDAYPDGLSETSLNDILWFEPDWCFEMCGMRCESEIREELEEAREELEGLKQEYEDAVSEYIDEMNARYEVAGMNELDDTEIDTIRQRMWDTFADDAKELEEKIAELKEELENI